MKQPISNEIKSLSWIVSDRIKQYMMDQQLKPGDRLPPERALSEALAVSRPVVREALSHLETLGLIEKHQGRGLFVKEQNLSRLFQEMLPPSNHDKQTFKQLVEFRFMIEQAALSHIMNNIQAEQLQPLYKIIEQSENDISDSEFIKLDHELHRRLILLSSNPYLVELTTVIDNFFAFIEQPVRDKTLSMEERKQSIRQHRQLLDFIGQGQKGSAIELLEEHLLPIYSDF
ncbi:FadR/GntR family transcriptional regulator [Paenibacillus sp. PAMC21692]|uniref:FadR/GntR family transcriptional regulator n=1 Tax=Paenibacillus sp. PAMC21692 TaxID=2762320 RepID=UPI00164DAC99|nr:GntR family transcriptional regulator [Paenibacillus sp. PAMC21692]QNK59252.1 FadR family transcriptional regulator [Paenibacillus sp. PAMC21692]